MDTLALRHALGRFATGVTIVTCRGPDGRFEGLTMNSFNALSLEPPLVLWALRRVSHLVPAFTQATHFAVNVLAESQQALATRFAGPVADRFAEGDWHCKPDGAPVLTGATAVFECVPVQHQALGDHLLFVGEVQRFTDADLPPLVFHGGRFRGLR
ncbi:MAG: flavin reductase family protein [Proteobacteria bacterium]|nr:flavin reductase family protein [Pseudomonadota bacterium]